MNQEEMDKQSIKIANSAKSRRLMQEYLEKSDINHGAQPIEAKRENKRISKNKLRKISINLIIVAIIVSVISTYTAIWDILKKKDLNYVSSTIVSEVTVNLDQKDLGTQIRSFLENMKSKGMSEMSVMYYVRSLYGDDVFDMFAQSLGYKNGGDYIIGQGYVDYEYSSSGETILASYPQEIKYGIDAHKQFTEDVNAIKEGRKGL